MRKNRSIEIGLHGSLHIEVGNALTLPERARWRPAVVNKPPEVLQILQQNLSKFGGLDDP